MDDFGNELHTEGDKPHPQATRFILSGMIDVPNILLEFFGLAETK